MKKYFSIGETAKINNVSIQALRLYDKMGLLKPAHVDIESKYRYYSIDQFMYLDLIRYSKEIGAPLKELSEVLNSRDITKLLSFIKEQQSKVEKEIIRLNNVSKAIGYLEEKIEYGIEPRKTNEIFFREIEKRFVIDVELDKKDKEREIEIKLRKKDKIVKENELMFEGEAGCFINLGLFLKEGKIYYSSVYSTLCGEGIEDKSIDIKEIPGGKFICITYLNDESEEAVNKIRKFIKENNIEPLGIAVESQLFNTINQWENNDLLYELQILI
ncbi:MerR family transcriptional regulator [Oceanirhabdus seepicola]|uniref:MerR family transcriptional regulator n=1 Tax=Oceanirhabdus seepicola TaxID=2828781 RepID=A0A9J6P6E6_9CLOT|nr:helix-turn-helix domain-containing protein [Oceanirhabdus seepicola]MCM1991681.1 MerR family transcriptional regulator [Oceanirhabdus seepicola]